MIFWIEADQGGHVVVIYLNISEVGNTVHSFCKNAMAIATVNFVQNFSFLTFIQQNIAVDLCYMRGDIVLRGLFRYALLQDSAGCKNGYYGSCFLHN